MKCLLKDKDNDKYVEKSLLDDKEMQILNLKTQLHKIKREISVNPAKEDQMMALEIEVQGLKAELFKERDLRRKE